MNALQVAALAAALVMTPVVPSLAQRANGATPQQGVAPQQGLPSQQGQMSEGMVQKVGTALRHVTEIREQYAQRTQSAKPGQQETLSGQAESEMVKAIGDQGLSVQQYAQAIQMAQADPTLRDRILSIAQSSD